MELLESSRSIVVLIDFQGKLMEMAYRSRLVIDATKRLINLAGLFNIPVILTEQYPQGLGVTHPEVRKLFDSLTTPTYYMDKISFGCCGDSKFEQLLERARPGLSPHDRQIVIAGIETHVCVLQTVVELLRKKNQVHLCWECVSGRGEEYRRIALERMVQAGAVLTNHESVGFEWARDKDHAAFKTMSRLLKEGQLT